MRPGKHLETEGIETLKMSSDEFTKVVTSEIANWGPIANSVIDPATKR